MEAAKVVQFVGKTLSFSGKRLFDILARLDNFGVGRIVYRNTFFNRYEEPCYYTITRVEPDMSCPTQSSFNKDRKSRAYGIKIFRGENLGETNLTGEFKADWRIVLKQDEDIFLKKTDLLPTKQRSNPPKTSRYPPLLEYMIMKEANANSAEPPALLQLRFGKLEK